VLVALAVAGGVTARADAWLLDRLRLPPPRDDGKPTRIVTALRDLTALGGDTLRLLFVLACLFGLAADHRAAAGTALLAILVVARLSLFVLKRIVRRPRPDAAMAGVATYTSSFPSGHTFLAVVVYLSAALLIPVAAPPAVLMTAVAFALALSLSIGATRIALGIHWPTDVIAGWCAGIAWVSGCILIVDGRV
jgi:undecaprenyl-diphosphatase